MAGGLAVELRADILRVLFVLLLGCGVGLWVRQVRAYRELRRAKKKPAGR